jgi:hypothetical protein
MEAESLLNILRRFRTQLLGIPEKWCSLLNKKRQWDCIVLYLLKAKRLGTTDGIENAHCNTKKQDVRTELNNATRKEYSKGYAGLLF